MTFDEVYLRYRSQIQHWIGYRFGEDISEDVTQETFIRLHRNWAKLDQIDNLRRWLFGTARYVAIHMLRAMQAVSRGAGSVVEWSDEAEEVPAAPKQGMALYIDQLRAHFAGLGPAQRDAVEALAAGDTAKEYSDRTGRSLSATTMALSLARKRLCEKLGDDRPYAWG